MGRGSAQTFNDNNKNEKDNRTCERNQHLMRVRFAWWVGRKKARDSNAGNTRGLQRERVTSLFLEGSSEDTDMLLLYNGSDDGHRLMRGRRSPPPPVGLRKASSTLSV